jgi:hypothetical protein
MTTKVEASQLLSHALLRLPPPLKDPLGEFPSLRRIRRDKSHKKNHAPWRELRPALASRRCGQGMSPPAAPPSHRPRLSRPHLDQWPRLDSPDTPSFI